MNRTAQKLKDAVKSGRMMHGCLVTGADRLETKKLVYECAALVVLNSEDVDALKQSPDFFDLDGSMKVDEIRSVRQELYKQTYSNANRAVIIRNIHLLNDNAVNAMLKMLEEPPSGTFFFLTGIEARILPTIRSRCLIVRLGTFSVEEIANRLLESGASDADSKLYAAAASGSLSKALRLYNEQDYRKLRIDAINALIDVLNSKTPFSWVKSIGKDRSSAIEAIEFMLAVCHDMMLVLCGIEVDTNLDVKKDIKRTTTHFTTAQIGVIIEKLVEAAIQLTTNASPNMVLDGLIAGTMEDIIK